MKEKDNYQADVQDENDKSLTFNDFLKLCLRNWVWFLISIVVCLAVAYYNVSSQEPVYLRSELVMIKTQKMGESTDLLNSFSDMGLVKSGSTAENELISITSNDVVTEVVRRLKLNVNYMAKQGIRPLTLYGNNNPVTVSFPDLPESGSGGFRISLQPNGTARLYEFWKGEQKFDDVINARLGFDYIKTPLGRVALQPNGSFAGRISQPMEFKVSQSPMISSVERYNGEISSSLEARNTDVLNISVRDVSIQRADDILNSIIEVYNEKWIEDKNKVSVATSKFINERLNVIEQELGDVDSEISDYKSSTNNPDFALSMQRNLEGKSMIDREIVQLDNQIAMAKYLRDFVDNPKNSQSVIPVNIGLEDGNIGTTVEQYNMLLIDYQRMHASSANNPMLPELKARLNSLRASLLESLRAKVNVLEEGRKVYKSSSSEFQTELSSGTTQARHLLTKERQQKVKEELYLFLLQKREENELTQTFTAYNTRIVAPPYGSLNPVAPKKAMTMSLAFAIALAVPALIIYLVEITDSKVRTRKDLEALDMPFAGEIPLLDRKSILQRAKELVTRKDKDADILKIVVGENRRDIPSEAFRVVRSNIDFMLGQNKQCDVVMLTSFNPGSGKSFISSNLAKSMELKGKRVLVIDGDLRHGSLSIYVDNPKKGISDYLGYKTDDWQSLIVTSQQMSGVDILPLGHKPPNPAELLENGRLEKLLDEARNLYDVVIIDCPPVNIVVDAQLIGQYVDRTIFVVRAGLLERQALKEIVEFRNNGKLRNVCVLLNGTSRAGSSYYHYGRYGYHHYSYYNKK